MSLSWTPLPSRPSRSSQSARLVSLDYIQQLLPSYFTHGGVYISVLLSQFIPLSRRNCVCVCVCVCAHVLTQSYPTLCSPMNCKLPGSSVHGIFQARLLEWVAISYSRGSSRPKDLTPTSWHLLQAFFTIAPPRKPSSTYGNLKFEFCLFCFLAVMFSS